MRLFAISALLIGACYAMIAATIFRLNSDLCAGERCGTEEVSVDPDFVGVFTEKQMLYERANENARRYFAIGSLTKAVTAFAALEWMKDDKIPANTPIARWFPQLRMGRRISLFDLLLQRSGLADMAMPLLPGGRADYAGFVSALNGDEPIFSPGAQFLYSNTNYELLGRILEISYGLPYDRVIRSATGLPFKGPTELSSADVATGACRAGAAADPRNVLAAAMHAQGAGGLFATEDVLVAFDRMMLAKYQSSLRVLGNSARGLPYTAGMFVGFGVGQPTYYHDGVIEDFRSYNAFDLRRGAAVLVLSHCPDSLKDFGNSDLYEYEQNASKRGENEH